MFLVRSLDSLTPPTSILTDFHGFSSILDPFRQLFHISLTQLCLEGFLVSVLKASEWKLVSLVPPATEPVHSLK